MTLWIIEPRDPLIVRDGRPFGPNPGARATTLPFPFPSTVVGALRHKAGLDDSGQFNRDRIATILKYGMRGPLLVQLDDHDAIIDWFLSAPADTLLLEPEKSANDVQGKQDRVLRRWLAPRALTATTNMLDDLSLVAPAERVFQKSSATAPRFWDRDTFYNWLITPTDDEPVRHSLGIHGLETNTRTHVSILPEHQTAREGALFQTSGNLRGATGRHSKNTISSSLGDLH
jgi:CRISPR-associated protein Cmr3